MLNEDTGHRNVGISGLIEIEAHFSNLSFPTVLYSLVSIFFRRGKQQTKERGNRGCSQPSGSVPGWAPPLTPQAEQVPAFPGFIPGCLSLPTAELMKAVLCLPQCERYSPAEWKNGEWIPHRSGVTRRKQGNPVGRGFGRGASGVAAGAHRGRACVRLGLPMAVGSGFSLRPKHGALWA